MMNLLLAQAGYPIAVIRTEDRAAYYHTLESAHEGQPEPFLRLIAEAVDRSLDLYLAAAAP